MASVKILVRHIESDSLALMEIDDKDPVPTTKAALKENGYALVDNHETALRRLYRESRNRPRRTIGFRPVSGHLRP
jgi:hypothetical protein